MNGKLKVTKLYKLYNDFLFYGSYKFIRFGCSMTKNCFRFPDRLERFILNRPKDVPLITYCNHLTCVDDPAIWGSIDRKYINQDSFRWIIGAKELCSGKGIINDFFESGKVIPVIRGKGVYQNELDKAVKAIKNGDWVHIFPEGKIHPDNNSEINDFKWGVGRFIMESKKCPIIIPIYLYDFDKVFFCGYPFMNLREKYVVSFGNPIDVKPLFKIWNKIRNDKKLLANSYNNFKSIKEADSYLKKFISEEEQISNSNDTNSTHSIKKSVIKKNKLDTKFTSTKHLWERLAKSKDKAFSTVPTIFKPSNYLNPLIHEDGNEHFMINGIQLLRSQFTNVLREDLISLKNETQSWIHKQEKIIEKSNEKKFFFKNKLHKRFKVNIFYENENHNV